MARRSVAYNQSGGAGIDRVTGDIKEASMLFLEPSSFDVITTNPPYMIGQHGLKNQRRGKIHRKA